MRYTLKGSLWKNSGLFLNLIEGWGKSLWCCKVYALGLLPFVPGDTEEWHGGNDHRRKQLFHYMEGSSTRYYIVDTHR